MKTLEDHPAYKEGYTDGKRSVEGGWPRAMMLRDIAFSPRPNSLYNKGFRAALDES